MIGKSPGRLAVTGGIVFVQFTLLPQERFTWVGVDDQHKVGDQKRR